MEYEYKWDAVSIDGEEISGITKASCKKDLIDSFEENGVVITKIRRVDRSSMFSISSLQPDEIHFFIVQLKTMLGSGIPLLDSLKTLSEVSEKRALRELIREILLKIQAGETLSNALSYYPDYFSSLTISLIEVGEQTGKLELALEQLLSYEKMQMDLLQKVRAALSYPLILFFVTGGISAALLIFVVPRFVDIFASMDAELPSLTLYVVELSAWLSEYWLSIIYSCLACIFVMKLLHSSYYEYRIISARLLLSLPVVGSILHKAIVVRYSKTLMTLLQSGVEITQACKRSAQVADNDYFIYALEQIPQDIACGEPLSQSLKKVKVIPDLMCQMIAVGEESGEINTMLEHTSQHYLSILTADVEQLGQMLEPVFLLILGSVVGLLVVALYLPIFDLMTVI